MRINILIGVVLAIGVAGCVSFAPPPPVPMINTFDIEDHRDYLGEGDAELSGQAFMRQQGGGVVTCAGQQVLLLPATLFFGEALSIMKSGRAPLLPHEQAHKGVVRETICDAQGNFEFADVPPGSWFVTTGVQWVVGGVQQGGGLLREVELEAGTPIRVVLTEKDFAAR